MEPSPKNKILVIDDEPGYVPLLRMLMPELEIRVACNATQALETARQLRPDCFIVDLVIPGMPGADLARLLRAMPEFASTPIFLFSALIHSLIEDAEPLVVDGFIAFPKPCNVYVLKRQIALHLASRPAAVSSGQNLLPGFIAGA